MQFTAQDRAYRAQFPDADFDVVLVDGRPAGRLYVARGTDLITSSRSPCSGVPRTGRGYAAPGGLIDEARHAGTVVRAQRRPRNPAVRLYQRLGFALRDEDEVRLAFEWRPPDIS